MLIKRSFKGSLPFPFFSFLFLLFVFIWFNYCYLFYLIFILLFFLLIYILFYYFVNFLSTLELVKSVINEWNTSILWFIDWRVLLLFIVVIFFHIGSFHYPN
jgi:hypothetical protein